MCLHGTASAADAGEVEELLKFPSHPISADGTTQALMDDCTTQA